MDSNPNNDWDYILKTKEQSNRLLDQQLLKKSIEDKKSYKQDLDIQHALKTQDKILTKEQKKTELLQLSLKNQLIQSEEFQKKSEKLEMQKFLAKQYEFQSNYLKNKQKLDQQFRLEAEKKKLQQIESQLIQDLHSKRQQKDFLMTQEQEILKAKAYEKSQHNQKLAQEKQIELELLQKRAEQDQIREKRYKDFYKKIESHQDFLQKLYLAQVSPQLSEKSKKVDLWIEKNIDAKSQALRAKEAYEQKIKQETMNNIKNVWKYQIDEKNEKINQLKAEQQQIFNTIQSQVHESKRLDSIREMERKEISNNYRENWVRDSGSGRRNSGASAVNSANFHARANSLAPNPAMYPSSPKASRNSDLSLGSSHNPITNPIGDSPPRPIQRPLFKPHTLIAI